MKTDNSIYLISRIREMANAFLLKELEQVGLTDIAPSHGDIIVALLQNNELTMTEIADKIHRDRSTVTTLVNKLIKLGYISTRKNSEDNRSSFVFLTSKGKALEDAFHEISQKLYETEYRGISVEEKKTFYSLLKKIHDNFN